MKIYENKVREYLKILKIMELKHKNWKNDYINGGLKLTLNSIDLKLMFSGGMQKERWPGMCLALFDPTKTLCFKNHYLLPGPY